MKLLIFSDIFPELYSQTCHLPDIENEIHNMLCELNLYVCNFPNKYSHTPTHRAKCIDDSSASVLWICCRHYSFLTLFTTEVIKTINPASTEFPPRLQEKPFTSSPIEFIFMQALLLKKPVVFMHLISLTKAGADCFRKDSGKKRNLSVNPLLCSVTGTSISILKALCFLMENFFKFGTSL